MLKIAIIGMGNMGESYLAQMMKSDICRPCAICDVKEDVLERIHEKYNIPCFTDYKDIPSNVDTDAAIINLPHYLHCESAVFFLEHGVHVLVEKPMANTKEECDRMLLAAKKSKKKMAIGHLQRYYNANRFVKKVIESGEMGKLCMFTEVRTIDYFSPNRPKWFLSKEKAGGGIVMNYGAHVLDKLFYVLDEKSARVMSTVGNIKNDCDIEGHAQFMLKFNSGVSGTVTFSGYAPCGYDAIYYFEKGALKVTDTTKLYRTVDGIWRETDVKDDEPSIATELREFCRYISGEPSEIPDGEYGKAVMAIIEKIYENN